MSSGVVSTGKVEAGTVGCFRGLLRVLSTAILLFQLDRHRAESRLYCSTTSIDTWPTTSLADRISGSQIDTDSATAVLLYRFDRHRGINGQTPAQPRVSNCTKHSVSSSQFCLSPAQVVTD